MILNESLNASCTCRPNLPAESSVGRGVDLLLSEDRWEGSGSILTLSFTSAAVSVCVCVCVWRSGLGLTGWGSSARNRRSFRIDPGDPAIPAGNDGGRLRLGKRGINPGNLPPERHRFSFTNQDRSFRMNPGPGGTRLAARDRSRK